MAGDGAPDMASLAGDIGECVYSTYVYTPAGDTGECVYSTYVYTPAGTTSSTAAVPPTSGTLPALLPLWVCQMFAQPITVTNMMVLLPLWVVVNLPQPEPVTRRILYTKENSRPDPMYERDKFTSRCVYCGDEMVAQNPLQLYCSQRCANDAYIERRSERRARARRKRCAVCGIYFAGARNDRKYCSNACKQKAYRARKNGYRIGS